jgi:hypothetical protein
MPQLSIISFFFQGLCFVLFLFIAHILILKYVLVPLEKKRLFRSYLKAIKQKDLNPIYARIVTPGAIKRIFKYFK